MVLLILIVYNKKVYDEVFTFHYGSSHTVFSNGISPAHTAFTFHYGSSHT